MSPFTIKFRLPLLIFLAFAFSVQGQIPEPQSSLTAEQLVEQGINYARRRRRLHFRSRYLPRYRKNRFVSVCEAGKIKLSLKILKGD